MYVATTMDDEKRLMISGSSSWRSTLATSETQNPKAVLRFEQSRFATR
jgi:hypothetical protein